MKIDSDGYKLSALFFIVALGILILNYAFRWPFLEWIAGLVGVLILYTFFFFRDPNRKIPEDINAAVSAADGVVVDVATVKAEGFENGEALRVAVFMNIFNVHVNRITLTGRVIHTKHRFGKKLSAYNKRAEYENE